MLNNPFLGLIVIANDMGDTERATNSSSCIIPIVYMAQ